MILRIVIFISFTIFSTRGWSQINSEVALTNSKNDDIKILKTVSLDHSLGFKDTYEESSTLSLDSTIVLNKKHSFRGLQSIGKSYLIDPSENEVLFGDTLLWHNYIAYRSGPFSLQLRQGVTLPISETSRDNDVRTRVEERISFNYSFFGGKLFAGYRPYVRYHFNKYKQKLNDQPATQYSYGHSFLAYYSINDKFAILGLYAQGVTYTEKGLYEGNDLLSQGSYSFYGSALWMATKKLTVRIGYDQTNSQISNGREQVFLFDEDITAWNLGMDYSF